MRDVWALKFCPSIILCEIMLGKDALDRLLSASKTTNEGYTQSYGYNAIGIIISTTMLGNYY